MAFLEKEGYITREPDPKDARSYILTATAEGMAFAEKLNEAILKADSIIMEPLDREEQQQLLRLLVKIGQA